MTDHSAHGVDDRGFALWQLGFRPFYLGASVFAALSIVLWALEYAGWLPVRYLQAPWLHAHEMLFGYTFAVIAGFLFTAVGNWTTRATASGPLLAAIFALWIAGRVLVLTPFTAVSALVNAAFPLAVAVAIAVPLARSGNRRNFFFVGLLALASAAELMLHASILGWIQWPARLGLQLGLDLVLFMIAAIAGRVVPMFTNNAIPGANASRHALVERASLGGLFALFVADAFSLDGTAFIALAVFVAVVHAARWILWRPWRTTRTPLVWILHVSYAWIPVHLALRAIAAEGWIAPVWATHALTLGVIGGMTIGMMTRTALGHTGHRIAADRGEVLMYFLVHAAAVVRVFGPLVLPRQYVATIVASAALWSAALALYALRYFPLLTKPRADGRPG